MEKRLEVIFDYSCPYCYKFYRELKELRGELMDFTIKALPCEAHPRPERYPMHSDLCVMGMYFCEDWGIDLWAYHETVFDAVFTRKIDYGTAEGFSEGMRVLLDGQKLAELRKALSEGRYQKQVLQNNHYAWEVLGLPAVPSLCTGGRVLRATPGVGIMKEQIRDFVRQ